MYLAENCKRMLSVDYSLIACGYSDDVIFTIAPGTLHLRVRFELLPCITAGLQQKVFVPLTN